MGYQAGTFGPIAYYQDNSGNATANQLQAGPVRHAVGSTNYDGDGSGQQYVSRSKAYVHNETIAPEGISFMVYTQAANDSWFFG